MSEPLSSEFQAHGDFAAMIERARDNIVNKGYERTFIHRAIEMEHLEGDDCPCRPIVVDGDILTKPEHLLSEIERCDG